MAIKQKEPNIVEDNEDDSIIYEEDNEKDKAQDVEDIYLDLSNTKFI